MRKWRLASSIRRLRSSLDSRSSRLVVTRPRTTVLPSGTKRKGSKVPERASSYSRKNEGIDDKSVAALRRPGGAEVAAAPAATVVDHAGGGDRELGRRRRHRPCQEPEGVGEDGLPKVHALLDPRRRRGELLHPFGVAEFHAHVVLGILDDAQPLDKVHVPGGAAELAVGGGSRAHLLLHPDGLAYRPVLASRSSSAVMRQAAKTSRSFRGPGGRSRLPT
jgi:hypothetical protein